MHGLGGTEYVLDMHTTLSSMQAVTEVPGVDTLTKYVLGSLCLVLIALMVYLIKLLIKAKDDHIKEKDDMKKDLLAELKVREDMASRSNDAMNEMKQALYAQAEVTGKLAKRIDAHAHSCPQLDEKQYLLRRGE